MLTFDSEIQHESLNIAHFPMRIKFFVGAEWVRGGKKPSKESELTYYREERGIVITQTGT